MLNRQKCMNVLFTLDNEPCIASVIEEALWFFVYEKLHSQCEIVDVKILDDDFITIYCDDKGIEFDETLINGIPAWQYDFQIITPDPRKAAGDYVYPMYERVNNPETYRYFSLGLVAAVSEFITIGSVCSGLMKSIVLGGDTTLCSIKEEKTNNMNGTYINFKPDRTLFNNFKVAENEIDEILNKLPFRIMSEEVNLICVSDYTSKAGKYDLKYANVSREDAVDVVRKLFTLNCFCRYCCIGFSAGYLELNMMSYGFADDVTYKTVDEFVESLSQSRCMNVFIFFGGTDPKCEESDARIFYSEHEGIMRLCFAPKDVKLNENQKNTRTWFENEMSLIHAEQSMEL